MDANAILEFFSKWGFTEGIAIVIIMTLTWLLRGPIYKAGCKYAEKYNVDKSAVTWVIMLIPFTLSLLAAILIELWGKGWNFLAIDWPSAVKEMISLAFGSTGLYECVRKIFQADKAAKDKAANAAKASTTGSSIQVIVSDPAETTVATKAEKKAVTKSEAKTEEASSMKAIR